MSPFPRSRNIASRVIENEGGVIFCSLYTDVNVGKKIESGDESKQGKEVRSSIQVKAADLQKKSPKTVIYFRLG